MPSSKSPPSTISVVSFVNSPSSWTVLVKIQLRLHALVPSI
jgi:hypothetical protein